VNARSELDLAGTKLPRRQWSRVTHEGRAGRSSRHPKVKA
jgi:hypothetical protein